MSSVQKIRKTVLFSTHPLEQAFVFPGFAWADILKSFYREKCDHVLTSPLLDTCIFFFLEQEILIDYRENSLCFVNLREQAIY